MARLLTQVVASTFRCTGSSVNPRSTSPSPWPHRIGAGSTANPMAGNRLCSAPSAIHPFRRASGAPGPWWTPWPSSHPVGGSQDTRTVFAAQVGVGPRGSNPEPADLRSAVAIDGGHRL